MRFLVFASLAALICVYPAGPTFAQGSAQAGIQRFCVDRWPNQNRIRQSCIRDQTFAYSQVAKMRRRFPAGSQERDIIKRCTARWTKNRRDGDPDYILAERCSRNRIQAFRDGKKMDWSQ